MTKSQDPRYADLEPEFKSIIADLARYMARIAEMRQGRATHTAGLMARGVLTVLDVPDVPPHAFFTKGRSYPVTLRHASFKGFQDDAVGDGRSASLRVLPGEDSDAGEGGTLMDLILSNGRTFVLGDAAIFHRWFAAGLAERARILEEYAPFRPSFEEFVRRPSSFTDLHYASQITYAWRGAGGAPALARFRLLRADRPQDSGFVDPAELQLPLDYVPRAEGDDRATTYLRDDFADRIRADGVEYILQVQLRATPADEGEHRRALDSTVDWPEAAARFRDLASVRLDRLVDSAEAVRQHLNVANLPDGLALPLTRCARHPASIAQLRSIVYDASAAARLGRPLPTELQAILDEIPPRQAARAEAGPLEPLSSSSLYRDLAPDLARTVATLGRELTHVAEAMGRVPNLAPGTAIAGVMDVLDAPDIPAHSFFEPGRSYPIIGRHENERGFSDDAVRDQRLLLLRVVAPGGEGGGPAAPAQSVMDLILFSGGRYLFADAEQMARWLPASFPARERLLRASPRIGAALRELIRDPDSFTSLTYSTFLAHAFISDAGERFLVRYRARAPGAARDAGRVDPAELRLPLDYAPRREGDERAPTYLRDDLRARVAAGGVTYHLELQLRPWPERADDEALDSSVPWPEDRFPFRDVARIHLREVIDGSMVRRRDFRPERLPERLPLLRARSATDRTGVGHLFAIVNDLHMRLREGRPVAPEMQALFDEHARATSVTGAAGSTPRRVCVIGGGAAGLSAAHALEKRGHVVTVLERAPEIGGKSAALEIAGRSYDLGTHICTGQYHRTRRLAAEVICPTEMLTPLLSFDLDKRALYAPGVSFMAEMDAYARLMEMHRSVFPGIHLPGLHHDAQKLALPIAAWLKEHGMNDLLRATGLDLGYASSGYGYLESPEHAMLYLMKMIDLSGFLDPSAQHDYQGEWTIAGCFMNLWRRVARSLRDVRCAVTIRAVERRPAEVVVHTDAGELRFDALVMALPLDKSLAFLDAGDEERDLFGRIRHNRYYTTVASARGIPREGFYMIAQHSLDAKHVGRCTAFHHRYADSDVYTFYAYGSSTVRGDDVRRLLAEDVRSLGGRLGEVHAQVEWDYHPHVGPADIRAGFYERMEALQGQRRTYYVGSLLAYELVECTIAYSEDLVERMFAAAQGSPEIEAKRARLAALAAGSGQAQAREVPRRSADEIRAWMIERLAGELGIPAASVSPTAALESFGLDSVVANALVGRFSEWLGFRITPAIIVEFPTIDAVAKHLAADTVEEGLAP